MLPRITVVTPSYNQGQFIERTLDSVLSQGYPNLEFIVMDGGSTDNSVEVIKKHEKHLTYWVSKKDRGQSHAINMGLARSTGDLLTWLNSDDWYTPGALAKFASAHREHPTAGMLVGTGEIVDLQNKIIYHKAPSQDITLDSLFLWLQGGNFMQPSSMFTREAWETCGNLDEEEHIIFDLDYWLRIAKAGFTFHVMPDLLSQAQGHPDAKTTAFETLMNMEAALVIAKHGGANVVKKRMAEMANKLAWYERNYETLVNHPVLKLLHPIVKRFGKEGSYWQKDVPPWFKQ